MSEQPGSEAPLTRTDMVLDVYSVVVVGQTADGSLVTAIAVAVPETRGKGRRRWVKHKTL